MRVVIEPRLHVENLPAGGRSVRRNSLSCDDRLSERLVFVALLLLLARHATYQNKAHVSL